MARAVGLICARNVVVAATAATLGPLALPVAGCTRKSSPSLAVDAAASAAPTSSGAKALVAESAACAERRRAVLASPAEPGTPELDSVRMELAGRVRGATVFWKRIPTQSSGSDDLAERVRALSTSPKPLQEVRAIVTRFRKQPARLRAALLREGYLFSPSVDVALALVDQLKLTDLFDEPLIFLHRRGVTHELKRAPRDRGHPERYVHVGGPLAGETAELLFADRLALDRGSISQDPLAADLRPAMDAAGLDRVRKLHWSGGAIAAEVRIGYEHWVPALFDASQPVIRLACLDVSPSVAERVADARAKALATRRVLSKVRQVIDEQIQEQLPFDAPRGGDGDSGDRFPLRPRWESAYRAGMRRFDYQGHRYEVYDEAGRPLPPQVCIEFVFDTWERAAGTYWAPMARTSPEASWEPRPARVEGTLSITELALDKPRHFLSFVNYALEHGESFDVWTVPPDERVQYTNPSAFFAFLAQHAERIREGDVLIFRRGRWEGRSVYHSVIVVETDPLTGLPTLVAGNAARPRLQTLQGIMQVTWRRFLKYRVRANPEWLDNAILRNLEAH